MNGPTRRRAALGRTRTRRKPSMSRSRPSMIVGAEDDDVMLPAPPRRSTVLDPTGTARSRGGGRPSADRKSTRLNSSHSQISYAVFCLKKKNEDGLGDGDGAIGEHKDEK